MVKIGITGAEGLIGSHLCAFLHGLPDVDIVKANRSTFSSEESLSLFVLSCDVIVHLAGMNRGDERKIAATNIALAESLIRACNHNNCRPHIIFSSSVQAFRDTPYGKSKRMCSEKFQEWAERTGARFTNLILPHVFGESGKPFYNSVVSTFCFQLANGQEPQIINDINLELIHAQQVADQILTIAKASQHGEVVISGTPISVSHLLEKLSKLAREYQQHQVVPALKDSFDLYLFNTYRSYLYPKHYPVTPTLHEDNRGKLIEIIKSFSGGQSFVSTTKPGVTRGNHYHLAKFERFVVLSGHAIIRIRKLFSNTVIEFPVSGEIIQYIDIPTLHTHSITNVGQDNLITLFWALGLFDPIRSDTFLEMV